MRKKLFFYSLLITALIFCYSCKESNGKWEIVSSTSSFQNDKWNVTVNSAEYQKDHKYQGWNSADYRLEEQSIEGLVVDLTAGYIGPAGLSDMPEVRLIRRNDKSRIDFRVWHTADGNDKYIDAGNKIGKNPETGEEIICRSFFIFPIPEKEEEYDLIIGDLPPITIKP